MEQQAVQDQWPASHPHRSCWGCGADNKHGLQIKSYWSGDESICEWKPKEYHLSTGDVLCGGIIASIIDCHCINTAVAAAYRAEGRELNTEPLIAGFTASLQVTYVKPTPVSEAVLIRARVKEMTSKKTVLTCSLVSKGEECARGEVVCVQVSS